MEARRGFRPQRAAAQGPRVRRAIATVAVAGTVAVGLGSGPPAAGTAAGERLAPGCGPIEVRGTRALGGCELRTVRGKLDLTVLSMFGDEPLGRCPYRFTARVGGGELVLEDVWIRPYEVPDPAKRQAGCGDVMPCQGPVETAREGRRGVPWRGRVESRGSDAFAVEMDACFDTCFGRFEGPMPLSLRRLADGGWRLTADRTPVGTSALELDGSWDLGRASAGGARRDDRG
jgi:hypothetical protein